MAYIVQSLEFKVYILNVTNPNSFFFLLENFPVHRTEKFKYVRLPFYRSSTICHFVFFFCQF